MSDTINPENSEDPKILGLWPFSSRPCRHIPRRRLDQAVLKALAAGELLKPLKEEAGLLTQYRITKADSV